MVQELQSYAVSEGEGKYETAVSHGYIGYGINVALAHEGLRTECQGKLLRPQIKSDGFFGVELM